MIDTDKELIIPLQLSTGRFKEFREELIPLANFSFSKYAENNAKYRVVLGNQNYDGIEKYKNVEYLIEITSYMDGKEENDMMKSMHSNKGIGFIGGRDFFESRDNYFKGFEKNVKKKVSKKYSSTKIIFVLTNEIFGILRPDIKEEIGAVITILIGIIKKYEFYSNELFLKIPTPEIIDETGKSMIRII